MSSGCFSVITRLQEISGSAQELPSSQTPALARPTQPVADDPRTHHFEAEPYGSQTLQAVRLEPKYDNIELVNSAPVSYISTLRPNSSTFLNDYFPTVVILAVTCGVFQLTSLLLGIPAVLCAFYAASAKRKYHFGKMKKLAFAALVLIVLDVLYTAISIPIIIGLLILTFY